MTISPEKKYNLERIYNKIGSHADDLQSLVDSLIENNYKLWKVELVNYPVGSREEITFYLNLYDNPTYKDVPLCNCNESAQIGFSIYISEFGDDRGFTFMVEVNTKSEINGGVWGDISLQQLPYDKLVANPEIVREIEKSFVEIRKQVHKFLIDV